MSTQGTTKPAKDLGELEAEIAAMSIRGQWQLRDDLLMDGPSPAGVPHIWRWADVFPRLQDACEAMPDSSTARRNFSFYNPALNWRGTTQTLLMGMQIVMPGETAWAHRHSMGAMRFAVMGHSDLYTVVDGEILTMETNDLVLTPNWTWHDHHNDGDTTCVWLDVLDVPLVMGLNQGFFAPYGKTSQARRSGTADHLSRRTGPLRPSSEQRCSHNFPYRYSWKTVLAALNEFAGSENPYEGLSLDYVNPTTGGPTLPTMACSVISLPGGFETKRRRRTTSAMYYIIEGEGVTVAGDREIRWASHDAFVVPNWCWHQHLNSSKRDRALLFCVTDEPVISQFGWYREEPEITLRRAPVPPLPPRA